jgi:hypothetical protein
MGKHSFDEKETKRKRNEQDDYEALKRLREEEKNKTKTTVKREEYEEEYDDDDDYEEGKSKKGIVVLIILLLLICAGVGGYFGYKYYSSKQNNNQNSEGTTEAMAEEPAVVVPEKQVQIYNGDQRPIACMIDNHKDAWPQFSINSAFTVYEIIVEGGETRLMALFQNKDLNVGPMRSSRHYFLDYALENDAVYVHWGWSPMAQSDIKNLGVNNINGLNYEGTYFYIDRSLPVALEHTGFTDTERIQNGMNKLGYRNTTGKDLLLHYSLDEIDMSKFTGAVVATDVTINYSNAVTTSYKYDENDKVYYRSVNGVPHKDYVTGKQYSAKNIIVYQVSNHTLPGDDKGRQDIDNLGSGEGYFISNGYSVPILWSKSSRTAQTKYTYLDGTEITVNDGNTYIQIQPKGRALNIG